MSSILAPTCVNFSIIFSYPLNTYSTFLISVTQSAFNPARNKHAPALKSVASTTVPCNC